MATAQGNSEEQKINAPTQPVQQSTSGARITEDFDQCFPALMNYINNFDSNVNLQQLQMENNEAATDKLYDVALSSLLDLCHEEIMNVIGEPWAELLKQNETFVARHSLMVLICVVRDPLYTSTSPEL